MRSSFTLANSLYLSDPNFFNYKLRAGGLDHFKCAFLLGKMRERGGEEEKNEEKGNCYNYLNKTMKISTYSS